MPEQIVQRKMLGLFSVDSGQCIIVDPCYLSAWKNNKFWGKDEKRTGEFSYDGACRETCYNENHGGELGTGSGGEDAVVSQAGYGDGIYPVYADYNAEGIVVRLVIDFSDCEPESRVCPDEE